MARIVGHVYKKIGLLSKGHFVEVSRTDLIAGYQGQTALKVKEVVEKAEALYASRNQDAAKEEEKAEKKVTLLSELINAYEELGTFQNFHVMLVPTADNIQESPPHLLK